MDQALMDFVSASPWGGRLTLVELDRVLVSARLQVLQPGEAVVRAGEVADKWVGIVDGLLVQSVGAEDGRVAILTSATSGTWFGEGSLIKRVPWGYDAVARRRSRVALVPSATFDWLRDTSLPFNQFLTQLLNERMSLYMGLLATERLTDVDGRMARVLASLFDPLLYPHREAVVRMSQADVALLAGMSRQRAHTALHKLQDRGLLKIDRSSLTVLDVGGLRRY